MKRILGEPKVLIERRKLAALRSIPGRVDELSLLRRPMARETGRELRAPIRRAS